MTNERVIHRDTAREEYFYRLGFQDGYAAFRALPDEGQVARQLEVATAHAKEQIAPEPERYYND